jgi:hypothetical protein
MPMPNWKRPWLTRIELDPENENAAVLGMTDMLQRTIGGGLVEVKTALRPRAIHLRHRPPPPAGQILFGVS